MSMKGDTYKSKAGRGHTKAKMPPIPIHMPGRYSTAHVLAVSGWSHSTLYKRMEQGLFPRPQKDGSMNFWPTTSCAKH